MEYEVDALLVRICCRPIIRAKVDFRVVSKSVVLALLILFPTMTRAENDESQPSGHEDADLKARLLQEAPHAWADYLQRTTTMRGKFTETFKQAGAQAERMIQYEFALNGEFVEERKQEPDGTYKISARNPEYAFIVISHNDGDVYSIGGLEQHGNNPQTDELIEKQSQEGSFTAKLPVWLYSRPLAEWLEDPEYVITKVAGVQLQGESLVRVDYDYQPLSENSGGVHPPIIEQYLVLDPNSHWVFREHGIRRSSGDENADPNLAYQKSHSIRKHEYRKQDDGFPLLVRSETIVSQDGVVVSEHTIEIEDLSLDVTPESEFYLTHYGLPEPNFERSWFRGKWLTYLIGGAACLGVAYWLRRRRLGVA